MLVGEYSTTATLETIPCYLIKSLKAQLYNPVIPFLPGRHKQEKSIKINALDLNYQNRMDLKYNNKLKKSCRKILSMFHLFFNVYVYV